jgi:colicin import membrane protein
MPRIILRPALVTLLIHGLLLYLLTANWETTEREIIRAKPAPNVINARLVDISEISKPKAAPSKPKAVTVRPKSKPKATPPKPKAVTPKPKSAPPKPNPIPKPKPKPKPTQAKPTPPQQSNRDAFAAIVRDELATVDAQQQATVTAGEMSASFVSLIQRTVVNYWSRPPSARNGMECELSIQLIPTGEVVNVILVRSSGNSAFDSSAINAVQKAGAFPELQNLPSREFEKNFRRLTLIFKPEDLRY